MCGGGENSTTTPAAANRRGTRRQRRRLPPDPAGLAHPAGGETATTAWDRPPPVASPLDSWKPRSLHPRTPQHVVSLLGRGGGGMNTASTTSSSSASVTQTWSAPPLLWNNQFLIAATATGLIYFWDLVSIMEQGVRAGDHDSSFTLPDMPDEGKTMSLPKTTATLPPGSAATSQSTTTTSGTAHPGNAPPPISESDKRKYFGSSVIPPAGLEAFDIRTVPTPHLVVDTATKITVESPVASAGVSLIALSLAPATLLKQQYASRTDTADTRDNNNTGCLVGLSVVGVVHVLSMHCVSASSSSSSLVGATLQHSWSTGQMGMQCVTVTRQGVIVIGYKSGQIEAWALESTSVTDRTSVTEADAVASAMKSSCVYKQRLLWRAALDYAPTIRSVIELQLQPPTQRGTVEATAAAVSDTTATMEGNDSWSDQQGSSYLVLTLQQETRSSTASMIEVVNATSVQRAWNQQPAGKGTDPSSSCVALQDHCILPHAGMEVVSSTTLPPARSATIGDDLPRSNWIPSSGTDCLCAIPPSVIQSSSANSNNGTSLVESCAAALADGTVLIMSSALTSSQSPSQTTATFKGMLEWGIQLPTDQLLLSYPAVGMGLVHYSTVSSRTGSPETTTSTDNPVPHIACCLRGGTTYLVPLAGRQQDESPPPPLSVVLYPHDIDSDIEFHRLQWFSAGDLLVTTECTTTPDDDETKPNRNKSRIPILIYAWPGGIIDVYAAQLLAKTTDACMDRLLLQELVSNGSAELLREHLLSFVLSPPLSFVSPSDQDGDVDGADKTNDDKLESSSLLLSKWKLAHAEISAWSGVGPLSLSDLASKQLESFRSVLLSLGKEEEIESSN